MNSISVSYFLQLGKEAFQHPWMGSKLLDFWKKIPFLTKTQKEDSALWSRFQSHFSHHSLQMQEKVRNVFKKYSMEMGKDVFKTKHRTLALAALHTLYVSDLGEGIKKLPPKKVSEKIESLLKDVPSLPELEDPKEGLKGVYKLLCQDSISRQQEKSLFIKVLATLKTPSAYWEYLTKQVAGRDLEEGMIIPALRGEDFYYIYRKINQNGLIAYALKPLYEKSDLPPVLFFRPTQVALAAENMVETLMDNLSLHGVGYEGFYASAQELDELMKDEGFRSPQDKLVVAGYSLAAVHAQRFISHRDNWRHFSEAILFNAPGIDVKTAQRFAQKINQGSHLLTHTPLLSFFRTEGDLVDLGGEELVGSRVSRSSNIQMQLYQIKPHLASESRLNRHFSCYLQGNADVERIDVKKPENRALLTNAKRGKGNGFLENVRKWVGFIFRPIYRFLVLFYSAVKHYLLARDSKET